MKKVFLISLISLLFAHSMLAQKTIETITSDCHLQFFPDNQEFIITTEEEDFTFTLEAMYNIMQKDVIKSFGLQEKYDTELKVNMFKKTAEYQELYESLCYEYDIITTFNKGYVLIKFDKETHYDLQKRCFNIKIKFDNNYLCSTPNYYSFGGGIALTYPSSYITFKKVANPWNYFGQDVFNILKTITIPEETALMIEENYPNSLLLVFKIQKSTKEFRPIKGNEQYGYYQPIVLGQTIGAYIVNEKTGEVYSDMSSIFKK